MIEKDLARINIMPFLNLEHNIHQYYRDGNVCFDLKIKNQGSNAAYNIEVDVLNYNKGWECVYTKKNAQKELNCLYVGHLNTDFLQVESLAEFTLMLDKCVDGQHYMPLDKAECDNICYKISFKDALFNEYYQEYSFNFMVNEKCTRIVSGMPQLKNKK